MSQWHKQPLVAPTYLKSVNSSACDTERRNEIWIRHCPILGWFQVVDQDIKLQNLPSRIKIEIQADFEIKEYPPIGGLIYTQKIQYEGQSLIENYVDLGWDAERLAEEKLDKYKQVSVKYDNGVLSIVHDLPDALPGFYLVAGRVTDRVGQSYFDINFVFRVKSIQGLDHDEQLRVDGKEEFLNFQTEVDEALEVEKKEIYKLYMQALNSHFYKE